MPTFDVVTAALSTAQADLVAVGAYAPASGERDDPAELGADALALAEALDLDLAGELRALAFDGSVGNIVRVPTRGQLAAATIVIVGLGRRADAGTTELRRAAASVANAAERVRSLATALHLDADEVEPAAAAQAVAEGFVLGSYRFTSYQSDPRPFLLEQVGLHASTDTEGAVREGVEVAQVTAGAACLTRDLVNLPPQDKRPPVLADRIVAEVEGLPIATRLLDEDDLVEGGYGGVLGVGQGSSEPPRLVELVYDPDGANRHVALVGKGITFDTGGVSLKPSEAMETMKMDMAGAATALSVIRAVAQLRLPVKVTAVVALAENMPSGTATRVSDVLTLKGGTTVEVTNTDAEGRLVLGDALVHASELEPDAIVDIATLTGAAVIALGERIGVMMASDDALAEALTKAADAAGEPSWRLPLANAEYGERLEGAIADLKNSTGREAGTILAGMFLHRFVGKDIPWAHLDVAGTAWSDEARGEISKGGTGVPVRTLIEWLRAD